MAKTFIIIINWNQPDMTIACLRSLEKVKGSDFEVIVVDNGSFDQSAQKIAQAFPRIRLIESETNLGFSGANNLGIRAALEENAGYILLLNNDTEVEPNFLAPLVEYAEKHPTVGVLSPRIYFFDQPERIWYDGGEYWTIFAKPYHLRYGKSVGKSGRETATAAPFATEWVSGCAMFLPAQVVRKAGELDQEYFFNYEDVDYCERIKALGYSIAVIPASNIRHKFGHSLKGKYSALYTYYRVRNLLLYLRKRKHWFALVLDAVLYPLFSLVAIIRAGEWGSLPAVFQGVSDFVRGITGKIPS